MSVKKPSLLARWMVTRLEVAAIVIVLVITIGGLIASIQDAVQLGEAINLKLTENLIVNLDVANLQRDVLITRADVLHLLIDPEGDTSKIVSRFSFAKVQIVNLVSKTNDTSLAQYVFAPEDLPVIQSLEANVPVVDGLIKDLKKADAAQRLIILTEIDKKLAEMESQIKIIIDRHATNQREAMAHTRDSLRVSQTTSLVTASVMLLMGIALAFVFRRGVLSRLNQVVEADRLKSQLLTSISHELRTPINAIQGYSQLLTEEAYGGLADEQKTTIRRIQLNATQLNGMVNNLLDRAQLEQGKMNLRPAPFSPADLINNTHSALNILATSKGLALTSEVESDVPPVIMGDVLRLQQILFNLTSNALKFTEKGSVHAHIFLPDEDHWVLEVTDTGIGIEPEVQAQVFAPFWQVDSSATRQYRGSGLGLAIVKQLSDLMGGVITLKSQPGQGSTFTIVFPLEKTA